MAEPIKTTIQEAFDHIKSWIAEGNKDKAIQGLNEILNFDPTNAEAQKLLLEVKTGGISAVAPIAAPTSTPAPTPTYTPVATPVAMPTPIPPPPMPPMKPMDMSPEPAVMPPRAVSMNASEPESTSTEEKGQIMMVLMSNMKLIVAVAGVLIAIIAGYIFYRNVLSDVGTITSDVKSMQDAAQTQANQAVTTPSTDATAVTPDATTVTPTDATTVPGTIDTTVTTPDATTPAVVTPTPADTTTPVVSDPSKVEATTGKVKRK